MIRVTDLQEWMYDNSRCFKDGPLILMMIKKLNFVEDKI
jgi:hypothetical protein